MFLSFSPTFDSETGLLQKFESRRWNDKADKAKRLWQNYAFQWEQTHGVLLPARGAAAWDGDKPWLDFTVEEVVYNVDVSRYIRVAGP